MASERKRHEEGPASQDHHVRALFDTLPLAVGHADAGERITFANRLYRATYSPGSDPVGRTIRDAVGEKVYGAIAPRIRQVLAGETVEFERTFAYPDGALGSRLLRYFPDRNAAGDVVGFYALIQDVSERKRAAQPIQVSEQRFRQSLDELLEGCMLIGFDWTYLYVNEAAARHGRGRAQDLIGRSMLESYPGVERSEVFSRYRQVMQERVGQRFESAYTLPDGEVHWYDLSAQPVPEGIFVLSLEITERKLAELARAETTARIRELLRRVVEVQEFERRRISAELHDLIGQNLSALGIEVESLRSRLPQEGAAVESNLDGMSRLIREMMGTVRATMADLRPPLLDDYGLAAAIEWYGRETERRSALRVVVESKVEKTGLARDAELALLRIAQEATMNAIKHSGASRVCIGLDRVGSVIRLTVEDDGKGFKGSREAHAATRAGVGLTVMRERAETAGGSLRIELPAVGTRIVAEVPSGNPGHTG